MKYHLFALLLALQTIAIVKCVVNIKEYTSTAVPLSTRTFKDIFGVPIHCPKNGALKKFSLKTDEKNIWYTYTCYSSMTDANEYDESILKSLIFKNSLTYNFKSSDPITALNKVEVICPVDYALSSCNITLDSSQTHINVDYSCVGVKTSYQTKKNTISSDILEGSANSLDALTGLICGDNTIESENLPGTPLKGFKFYINLSDSKAKAQFYYSYYKLRNIDLERKQWAKNTEELRSKNTQKN